MKKEEWKFEDNPTVAVLTIKSILNDGKPILFVSHDEEDALGWIAWNG